nr:hypothetical protein BaRGS_003871 [Batillaria attramentaria]
MKRTSNTKDKSSGENSQQQRAGEEEERAPQADLEEELALRAARLRPDMGGGQDLRQGQFYEYYAKYMKPTARPERCR